MKPKTRPRPSDVRACLRGSTLLEDVLTGRKPMVRRFIISSAAVAAVLTLSPTTLAQQGQTGTAQEARVMLDKVVAAVKADQAVALGMFNKGEGGFRDRDLYPFCFRIGDGKLLATPVSVASGTDIRTLKDPTGKVYGPEVYAAAQKPEGQITEVSYMFPRPGTAAPAVPKVSYVTKAGDLGCGVGYYK
jgi:Single Cache domain 2